ncbi:hypothetical protein TNCV_2131281 [Trichonephila clavipes]|nr:hypothetical protein TNCV_2131281 [Trichonephila clavipes]
MRKTRKKTKKEVEGQQVDAGGRPKVRLPVRCVIGYTHSTNAYGCLIGGIIVMDRVEEKEENLLPYNR